MPVVLLGARLEKQLALYGCLFPDLSALGGVAGVDLTHVGGLIRSLPNLRGCGSSQYCLEVTSSQVQCRS
jgi:hypothetical protein